jgi:hypothetical protein
VCSEKLRIHTPPGELIDVAGIIDPGISRDELGRFNSYVIVRFAVFVTEPTLRSQL